MYLIDTNVISEIRKKQRANPGVQAFFIKARQKSLQLYLSVITLGELRQGIEKIRHRGDLIQATKLETWLHTIAQDYSDHILSFGDTEAQIWGKLRVPHHENAINKQIAATALVYDMTVVTRNTDDFAGTGVELFNPFTEF